ncbi:ubiquitin-conjugating enzyme E2 J2-like [Brevipalpus obovatus]|uniref:ubiquitin-conjugating enzyme E2 J2-like n=1 Tax=Brevipalpus obovatus TaxID=246614 RepID=UPI003D9F7101
MAPSTSTQRLKREYLKILKDPVPHIVAHPLPENILEWHYVIRGPEGTPYENGIYHGKLKFPPEYPFKPPSILIITPNGRFKCNMRLCLSISDYHPQTWNPVWSISTILTGLLSFMLENNPTMGSIETKDSKKRAFARESWQFNLENKDFCRLFPELVEECREKIKSLKQQQSWRVTDRVSEFSDSLSAIRGENLVGSALVNIGVVVGFVAFLYTARCVISALNDH